MRFDLARRLTNSDISHNTSSTITLAETLFTNCIDTSFQMASLFLSIPNMEQIAMISHITWFFRRLAATASIEKAGSGHPRNELEAQTPQRHRATTSSSMNSSRSVPFRGSLLSLGWSALLLPMLGGPRAFGHNTWPLFGWRSPMLKGCRQRRCHVAL